MRVLSLRLLGPIEAQVDGGPALSFPTRKTQALLAYLGARPGQRHTRERLAALFWGNTAEEQSRNSLRQALHGLGRALGPAAPRVLSVDPRSVALDPEAVDVDVVAFERLAVADDEDALESAVTLYRGDFLEGLTVKEAAVEEWIRAEQERLRDLAIKAIEKLVRRAELSAPEHAIHAARRLLALDPVHEEMHRVLMRLHLRAGRWAAALVQYQACRNAVYRHLGVEPERVTRELHDEIVRARTRASVAPAFVHDAAARPVEAVAPGAAAPDTGPPEVLGAAPLVGREHEITRLRELLDGVTQGRGRVAGLLGPVGIGKSRLIEELSVDAAMHGSRVIVGRCYETEQALPLRPWIDAFRAPELLREIDRLDALNPAWRRELARVFPELAPSAARPDPDAGSYPRLFEALEQVVQRLAARAPVIVVLEDAHWADELSLGFFAFLSHRIATTRVLALLSARTEELDATPLLRQVFRELDRDHRFVTLKLAPLSRDQIRSLVRVVAGPATTVPVDRWDDDVWRTSEGNPFMALETLRALQQGEFVERDRRGLPLPERVRGIVTRRLDRLSRTARALVDVAAVISHGLEVPLLARAAQLDESELGIALDELVRRELLHVAPRGFEFTHDRVREVAYAEIGAPRRRLLHRTVAEAIEALHAADLVPQAAALALHYGEAALWDRALHHAVAAGERALRYGALREAAAAFERAIVAIGHLPETPETLRGGLELRIALRHSLLPLAETARIRDILGEAESLARRLGDEGRRAEIAAYRAVHHWWVAEYDTAQACCAEASAIAEGASDPSLAVSVVYYEGQIAHARGEYRRAAELFRRALAAGGGGITSRHFGTAAFTQVFAASWLSWTLAELGDRVEAEARAVEAMRFAEATPHPYLLGYACAAGGFGSLRRGDATEAAAWFERLRDTERTASYSALFPLSEWCLAYVYALAGRPEAQALVDQVTGTVLGGSGLFYDPQWLVWIAEAHLLLGRADQALTVGARSLELARARGERGHEAWALRLMGEIAASHGATDEAEGYYVQALGLSATLGMRPLRTQCYLGLSRLYRRSGRAHDASQHRHAATLLATAIGMRLDTADVAGASAPSR